MKAHRCFCRNAIGRDINLSNYKLIMTSCLLKLCLGNCHGNEQPTCCSVPAWPDVFSSSQDKRPWTCSRWYFLALQSGNWEGDMVSAILDNHYKPQTTEGFLEDAVWGIWGQSCSLSMRSTDIMGEGLCVRPYPGLQKMPWRSIFKWFKVSVFVGFQLNFSRRCWLSEMFSFFQKQEPLTLGSLNRGL